MGAVRENLRTSVAESAAPYGYTLTIFATGSVGTHLMGTPHVFQMLLFVAGAVAGFAVAEAAAYGRVSMTLGTGTAPRIAVWGNAHLLSAGAAIGASWAVLQVLAGTDVGWVAIGFTATAVYLVLYAVQLTIASGATRATHRT